MVCLVLVGVLIAVPIPVASQLQGDTIEHAIEQAVREARCVNQSVITMPPVAFAPSHSPYPC